MLLSIGVSLAALAAIGRVSASVSDPPSRRIVAHPECSGGKGYIALVADDWTSVAKTGDNGRPYWSLWGGDGNDNRVNFNFEGDYTVEYFHLKTFKSNDPAYTTWNEAWNAGACEYGKQYNCTIEVPVGLSPGVCWDITVTAPNEEGAVIFAPPEGSKATCVVDYDTPVPTSLAFK